MLAIYTFGVLATLAWLAYINHHSARETAAICVLWPVIAPLIAFVVCADAGMARIGWCFEVADSTGGWGARRPDDGQPGIAVRCPWFELQFWKSRAAQAKAQEGEK